MAKSVRLDFKSEGFRQILTSPGVRAEVDRIAQAVLSAAGGEARGYGKKTFLGSYGGGRWVSTVFTETVEGIVDESKNRTLYRAIFAGR